MIEPQKIGPYKIIDTPTLVTYKVEGFSGKQITRHRNNIAPYYPKDFSVQEGMEKYFSENSLLRLHPKTTTINKSKSQAPHPEIIDYSNTPKFPTQTPTFANSDKTHSSELPQPFHTVSNISDTPQDISLISDTSISDPLSSQFCSPTPSQIVSNFFNPPQRPICKIEGLLLRVHWNHSFNIVNFLTAFSKFNTTQFPRYYTYNHTQLNFTNT